MYFFFAETHLRLKKHEYTFFGETHLQFKKMLVEYGLLLHSEMKAWRI